MEIICGNELAMQRKINLSIQLPKDNSSLLPIHSDVWSGCSPFEVVLWVPLVDVYNSKSMFIFPKNINDKVYKKFSLYKNFKIFFDKYKNKIKFLNLKFGQGIIFAHSIIHGNIVNNTNETRWSFNCRFKSLMSPYYKKDIAETFIPISIKPATNIGLEYDILKSKKAEGYRGYIFLEILTTILYSESSKSCNKRFCKKKNFFLN